MNNNNDDTVTFNAIVNYIKTNPDSIIQYASAIESNRKSLIDGVFYRTGRVVKKITKFVKSPETKAAVLLGNWAATAVLLILMMIAASQTSLAALAVVFILFVIETYAVFGNVEYTLAYASAKNYFKAA